MPGRALWLIVVCGVPLPALGWEVRAIERGVANEHRGLPVELAPRSKLEPEVLQALRAPRPKLSETDRLYLNGHEGLGTFEQLFTRAGQAKIRAFRELAGRHWVNVDLDTQAGGVDVRVAMSALVGSFGRVTLTVPKNFPEEKLAPLHAKAEKLFAGIAIGVRIIEASDYDPVANFRPGHHTVPPEDKVLFPKH